MIKKEQIKEISKMIDENYCKIKIIMKKEQIEEMAKVIDESHWRIEQDFTGCHINSTEIAESLYNAGYRKQIEIEKEIFKELSNIIYNLKDSPFYSSSDAVYELTELKKKYVEETEGDIK